jgi:hypothetical protein
MAILKDTIVIMGEMILYGPIQDVLQEVKIEALGVANPAAERQLYLT